MQKQIDDMIAWGVASENTPIKRKRDPGDWLPHGREVTPECPSDTCESDSRFDEIVFDNVHVIIKIDEVVTNCPAEGGTGGNN